MPIRFNDLGGWPRSDNLDWIVREKTVHRWWWNADACDSRLEWSRAWLCGIWSIHHSCPDVLQKFMQNDLDTYAHLSLHQYPYVSHCHCSDGNDSLVRYAHIYSITALTANDWRTFVTNYWEKLAQGDIRLTSDSFELNKITSLRRVHCEDVAHTAEIYYMHLDCNKN